MIISLGGTPGSGKSSIGRILSKKLGYNYLSLGKFFRDYAEEKHISLEEFEDRAKKDSKTDIEVDNKIAELSKKDKLILDGRMAWHFAPKSFKVWIDASEDERAKRIMKADREEEEFSSLEEAKKELKERFDGDISRYKKLYDVDCSDENNYDFIIDTTNISAEEAAELILGEIEKT